jgi:hypothetical protein
MILSPKKLDRRPLEDIHNVLRSPISKLGVQVSDHDENRYANPKLTPKKRRLGSSIEICENNEKNLSSVNSICLDVHNIENHGEKLIKSRLAIAFSPNFNSPQPKVKHLGSSILVTDDFQSPKSNSKKRKDVGTENQSFVFDDSENKDPHNMNMNMKSPLRSKATYNVIAGKSGLGQKTPEANRIIPLEMEIISENIATQSSALLNGDLIGNDAVKELASADNTFRHLTKSESLLGDDTATFYLSDSNSFSFEGIRLGALDDDRIGVEADLRPSVIGSNMGSSVRDDTCLSSTVAKVSKLIDYRVIGPKIELRSEQLHNQKASSYTDEVIQPTCQGHSSDRSMDIVNGTTSNDTQSDTDFSYAYILRDIERMKLHRQLLDNPDSDSFSENLPRQSLSTVEIDTSRSYNILPYFGVSTGSTNFHPEKSLNCSEEASESVQEKEGTSQSTSQFTPQNSSVHDGHASVCQSASSSDTRIREEVELESTSKDDPISTSEAAHTHSSATHTPQQGPPQLVESKEEREDREFSSFRATIAAARESSLCVLFRGSRGPGGQGLTQVQQQAVAFHKSEVDFLSSSAVLRRGEVLAPLGTQGGDTTVLCNPRLAPQRSSLETISCDTDLSISGTVVTVLCSDDKLNQSHYLSARVPLSELNAYQEKVQLWKGKYKTIKPPLTSKHYPGYLPHSATENSKGLGVGEGPRACTSPSSGSSSTSASTPGHPTEGEVALAGHDAAVEVGAAVAEAQEGLDVREPCINSIPSPSHLLRNAVCEESPLL